MKHKEKMAIHVHNVIIEHLAWKFYIKIQMDWISKKKIKIQLLAIEFSQNSKNVSC